MGKDVKVNSQLKKWDIVVDNNNCTHYWIIGSGNIGRCRYCKEVRDFGKLQRKAESELDKARGSRKNPYGRKGRLQKEEIL